MSRENDEPLILTEAQREFLNGLIVSKRIMPESPGVLYDSIAPLTDEDMAFVDETVKDIPDIRLPWHDPEWQIRERFKRDTLLQERLAQALADNARYVCVTNEIEMALAKRYGLLSQRSQEVNAKLQDANLTDEDEKMEARIAFVYSWSAMDELEENSRTLLLLRQERNEIESATKGTILEQLQPNETSAVFP